ncbi:BamA/TamA family outer membrane protein [Prochlorococcus marinus]|uniref:BamA/TamA family outer membrane protein n=1 Tax=Prochlorococcus marinus TaxID=1219 RepID=UPI0022B3C507|nr:BamA/TamA family outer membrane protein [Prochlorococcus marinus]
MLKRSSRPNQKLISKSAYAIALVVPLISIFGETKASKIISSENQFFVENKIGESFQFNHQSNNNKFNLNLDNFFISEGENQNDEKTIIEEQRVLISEILIEGLEDHPDKERLEDIAYDAMLISPGSKVTSEEVKKDLDRIYSTGWFSGAKIESLNSALGVKLLIKIEPNPILNNISILPLERKISNTKLNEIFNNDYGKTLNLNTLKIRIKEIKDWYSSKGYSLARISGPSRVTKEGRVELNIQEGYISGIEISFIDEDGNTEDEKGRLIKGKTKTWVIERELITKVGDIFNRNKLESDIKRLYSTSLFNDVKVTLKPVSTEPGKIIISLGITEQRTGSLTGGLGYSGGQGVFGQIGLQESNLVGRAWSSNMNLTYGEYGALLNLSLYDPWIKNDKHRTSFRTSLYLSREVPQEFRSQEGGSIRGVTDRYEAPNSLISYDTNQSQNLDINHNNTLIETGPFTNLSSAQLSAPQFSWFDYEGDSIVLERTGGGFSFARPLNGGQPLKKVPWSVLIGANLQKVKPIDYAGDKRPYGVASTNFIDGKVPENEVICVAYNCSTENTLVSLKSAVTYNNLDNSRNPTSGDYLNIGSEQFISLGENSPTFNRTRVSYSRFYPINWLKFHKGCRPKSGEKSDCSQSIGFQAKIGTIIGDLPPYEAFCLGGASSVRGWNSCDLGVARNFGEATGEYRFPIWRLVSGVLFVDVGSDFGSQSNVPGKPGKILEKPGSGFSVGPGAVINTPVGPIRIEAASQDFSGNWRYNIGIGWKF